MYPPPEESLSDATIRQLDDQFFTSDPFAHIRSRITCLIAPRPSNPTGPLAHEFIRLLGPSSAPYAETDDRVEALQVAVDAFALRQHVAETLLRFLHVVLHHEVGASYWVELTDSPMSMRDVCQQNHATLSAAANDAAPSLRSVLVSPALEQSESGGADTGGLFGSPPAEDLIVSAMRVHIAWINYATAAVVQDTPDLHAANNKFKHGMGLRPQDDLLMAFTTTPPNPDGGIPLSALTGDNAVPLFDGITAEYLARASRRHGVEITQISLNTAATLVAAAAMAHTLGLLFHVAASNHFIGRAPTEGRTIPADPGLLVDGPLPAAPEPPRAFALRFPLSTPLREPGSPEAVLVFTNGERRTLTFGDPIRSYVIEG